MTTPSPEQLAIAPWMRYARAELGVREVPGVKHSPRVLEYIAACDRGTRPWLAQDETSWCAAFVAWVLLQVQIKSTRNLAARSYLKYGDAISPAEARYGDICVFWRGVKIPASVTNAPGHVAFFDKWSAGRSAVDILGGNQGNRVSIETRPASKLLAIRRPSVDELSLFDLMARGR